MHNRHTQAYTHAHIAGRLAGSFLQLYSEPAHAKLFMDHLLDKGRQAKPESASTEMKEIVSNKR